MKTLSLFVGVCSLLVAIAIAGPIITVAEGQLEGHSVVHNGRSANHFIGVPYATPPVDSLRWEAPLPAKKWSGIRQATAFGPECIQSVNAMETTVSEDCLYLNIFAPGDNTTKTYPVMIYFFGGSWEWGGTSLPLYDGDLDVLHAQDVILVTVNYRLGAFGYLASPQLAAQTVSGTAGNFGLLDQQMAMKWVHENAAAFRGDPQQVTIFGESAGGGSTSNHLVMPSSWPYFQAAMMQSGPPAFWIDIGMDEATRRFDIFCSNIQCNGSDPNVVSCLRSKTPDQILAASHGWDGLILTWAPVVDGFFLTERVDILMLKGEWAKVPVLLGTNLNEGSLFTKLKPDGTQEDFANLMVEWFGETYKDKVLEMYNASTYGSPFWASSKVMTEASMECPCRRAATVIAESENVYVYELTRVVDVVADFDPYMGVFHGEDIGYVFHISLLLNLQEIELSNQVVTYWTNFAKCHKPNCEGGDPTLPLWPSFRSKGTARGNNNAGMIMNLNIPPKAEMQQIERCHFWDTWV